MSLDRVARKAISHSTRPSSRIRGKAAKPQRECAWKIAIRLTHEFVHEMGDSRFGFARDGQLNAFFGLVWIRLPTL